MPLNENLERRRRQNIALYNATKCCHICGSASRNAKGFSHFMDTESNDDSVPTELAGMRLCACFQRPSSRHPDSCPLRVCEMCIKDDILTGRIRCCALCGVIACDENCVEMVECTDKEEWLNEGCLECRGYESFNQIDMFRRRKHSEYPRINRVCTKCLDMFTLVSLSGFKNYQFKCRYFKCNRLLVQSDIVELKRFLKPFPVSMLPEEMFVDIIDFLGIKDLVSTALTCTTLFKKIENMSKDLVESVQQLFPTGPIITEFCESMRMGENDRHSILYSTMSYASGRNCYPLRAPEDGKTWLSVLESLEKLTRCTYFGFQAEAGDEGCSMRYLKSKNNVSFDRFYSETNDDILPQLSDDNFSVLGGQASVGRFRLPDLLHERERFAEREARVQKSIVFAADEQLDIGIRRVVTRYYHQYEHGSIGKVGILSKSEAGVEWLGSVDVTLQHSLGVISEEVLIGMEYNPEENKLRVFTADEEGKDTTEKAQFDIPPDANDLRFAASLSSHFAHAGGNLLSIRSCNPVEWDMFMSHNHHKNLTHRYGSRRHDLRRHDLMMRHRMRARLIDIENSDDESVPGET